MKRILEKIGINVITYLAFFVFTFLLVWSFCNIFVNFNLLSFMTGFWIAFAISACSAMIFLIYLLICLNSSKSNKLNIWLSQNYPKIILYYLILNIIFISIKTEIIWTSDTLKDIISLEWTIFGISVAIFLVWNIVIFKYLEKVKPKQSKNMCLIEKRDYILKKEEFYPQASALFDSVTLLIINLIVLVISTGIVFIIKEEVTLFRQNIVIVSFYFCTNTLVELLLDILKPLNEEKKAMLKETKVTASDIKEKNEIEQQLSNSYRLIQEIDQLESVDEEQKLKMKTEIVFKALGIDNLLEEKNKHSDSE